MANSTRAHAKTLQNEYQLKYGIHVEQNLINGLELSAYRLEMLADSLDGLTD
jgi:hypothetical protein